MDIVEIFLGSGAREAGLDVQAYEIRVIDNDRAL